MKIEEAVIQMAIILGGNDHPLGILKAILHHSGKPADIQKEIHQDVHSSLWDKRETLPWFIPEPEKGKQ